MILDALEMVKHDVIGFTKAAQECSNQQMRQTIIQFRDNAEQNQMNLVKLATEKGWYIPSPSVDPNTVQQVKQQINNAFTASKGSPVHMQV